MIKFEITANCDVTIVFPNGTIITYNNVSDFIIDNATNGTGIYNITIQNGTNPPFTLNLYLEENSYITTDYIQITVSNSFVDFDDCNYYHVIYHPCKKYITVINTFYLIEPANYYIKYGDYDYILSNSITFSAISPQFTIGTKICTKNLELLPGCCGSYEYVEVEVRCKECENIIDIDLFKNNYVSFFIDCGVSPTISIDKDIKNDICKGYCNNGCSCEEIRQCKCIPLNYLIKIKYEGAIELLPPNCTKVKVDTYINGYLVSGQLISNINELEDLEVEFEDKGVYEIEVRLTDCCGYVCIYKDKITVGGDIFIKTMNCPQIYKLYNYKNYGLSKTKGYINIYSIKNEKLTSFDLGSLNDKTEYTFSLNGNQGIYILEFIEEINNVVNTYRFIIYDICKIYECYLNNVKKIIEEECIECNDKIKKENMLLCEYHMLFNTLQIYIDIIMKRSEGYYRAEDIPNNNLYEIDYIINKLLYLCNIKNENINTCC